MKFLKRFLKLQFVLLSLLVCNMSYAQIPTTPEKCGEVSPIGSVILKANGFDLLYMAFDGEMPSDLVFKNEMQQDINIEKVAFSSYAAAYKITDSYSNLQLKGINDCGNEYRLFTYKKESAIEDEESPNFVSPEDQPIPITIEMSDALVDYTNGEIPLNDFLIGRTDLNPFERAYVYQRSILNSAKVNLTFEAIANNPIQIISAAPAPEPPGNCDCHFFNVRISISPSDFRWHSANYYANVYGHIWNYDDINDEESLANEGNTWKLWNIMGPGGWRGLWTDGFKEKKNFFDYRIVTVGLEEEDTEEIDVDFRTFRTEIVFNLICNDAQQLPAECGCDRDIHFNYNYNTKLTAKAILNSGGGGNKESVARVRDVVMVYEREQGDSGNNESVEILAMGDFGAGALCERDLNPEFWGNVLDLAGDVVEIYLLVQGITTDNPDYADLYYEASLLLEEGDETNIFESAEAVITSSYFLPADCGSEEEINGISDTSERTLRPNKRLTLGLLNQHSLYSGGMRSWQSEATRSADFSITAIVEAGEFDGPPIDKDCCSPVTGVYAYYDILFDKVQGNNVNDFLFDYSLDSPIGLNDFDAEAFAGVVTRPANTVNCPLDPNVTANDRLEKHSAYSKLSDASITIHTIDGRLVEQYKTSIESENSERFIRNQLRDKGDSLPLGIYIVSISNEKGIHSFKYLNR